MPDTDLEKQYDEHAALVGHVTLAWSNIHSEVFAIFSLLCGMEGRRSEAIFFALKSDASQLTLLWQSSTKLCPSRFEIKRRS